MGKLKIAMSMLLVVLIVFAFFIGDNMVETEMAESRPDDTEVVSLGSPDNVSDEDTLSKEVENVTSTSEYIVERDGVVYKFLFTTPANVDAVIDSIKNIYDKDFSECTISYMDDMNQSSYEVTINSESFLINAVD